MVKRVYNLGDEARVRDPYIQYFSGEAARQGCGGEEQLSDTTVQENNITFPTDAKLAKMIIDKCNKIARKHSAGQRQSYVRISEESLISAYNSNHPECVKKARK